VLRGEADRLTPFASCSATVTAFVALGSNIDEPEQQIGRGLSEIGALPETRIARVSSLYRSAPVGYRDQPDFLNAVAAVETGLAPRALLDQLLAYERAHGRVGHNTKWPPTHHLDKKHYG
jgi:2-amino-4-hydroxy-6-hydroxymethyldihydropteridine diphosphokinase